MEADDPENGNTPSLTSTDTNVHLRQGDYCTVEKRELNTIGMIGVGTNVLIILASLSIAYKSHWSVTTILILAILASFLVQWKRISNLKEETEIEQPTGVTTGYNLS